MRRYPQTFMWAGALALAVVSSVVPSAQQKEYTNNLRFNSGQGVQPVFEGWSHAADGGYNLHFGYLNRNYIEQPSVPVGVNNSIEPGGPDRGQPTFFYNRTQRNLFTVNVPKDWGATKELIWTVTVNGKTEKAFGWLQPEWEIDPVGGANLGGRTDEEFVSNKAPSATVAPVSPLTLPAKLSLTATVTDDGLPKVRPRGKPAVGQETPPTLQGGVDAPVNVPQVSLAEVPPGATAGTPRRAPDGLNVSWIVWRGPAAATFEPYYAEPKDGKATTTAVFSKPGEYVLQAVATDGWKVSRRNVTVTVK